MGVGLRTVYVRAVLPPIQAGRRYDEWLRIVYEAQGDMSRVLVGEAQ